MQVALDRRSGLYLPGLLPPRGPLRDLYLEHAWDRLSPEAQSYLIPPMIGGADTKVSALTAVSSVLGADEIPVNEAGTSKKITVTQLRDFLTARNANTTGTSAAYAADTYLAGSGVTFASGTAPLVGTLYYCAFDMVKTGAGTATPIITLRFGTLGTTGDAAILTFTFAVGTAVIDTGIFEVWATFRTVGSGTSAVLAGIARCTHHLAATGLTTTGASGTAIIIPAASGGFNSTPANSILGASFNGGASFSGTNVLVRADMQA